MTLIVTGVGALIHLYSVGYMAHDEDYARFFAYLNLFALSMLVLVLADNLLLMFVGWEGVGLCSYLLIAFWYDNAQFAYNGRKAFIVNRVGDAGFILGIFTIVAALGAHGVWTLNFADAAGASPRCSQPVATIAGLLLLLGATGKSAQIPLYVWLPDAMVGPTPVSALDPCRDHGDRRRLHDRAAQLPLHAGARRDGRGRDRRRRDRVLRRDHRDGADRHQERARLLDHQPARLHVPGSRRRARSPPASFT